MKEKLIKIKDIVVEPTLYPRASYSWQTPYSYSKALQAGSRFPPIEVCERDGKFILIDGKHRIEANKKIKQEFISAEVHKGLTDKEIFVRALEGNLKHGYQLSFYDKAIAISKLKDFNFSVAEISKLMQIVPAEIKVFQARQVTNSITGQAFILKAPLKLLEGKELSTEEITQLNSIQEKIGGKDVESLADQLIGILSIEKLQLDDATIRKLERLYNILNERYHPVPVK